MGSPIVTVVCLCYNQGKFIRKSIESVFAQSYSNIQLIIIDDASSDESAAIIQSIVAEHPGIECLLLEKNVGSCKAFNKGLDLAEGEFIIDLAADDILLPGRIQKGVDALQSAGDEFAITFSDARYIDEVGHSLWIHSEKYPHDSIPQGDIYVELISRYFICPPTMMMRTHVLRQLKGYDESLHYEDFDLLIRVSRNYKLCYVPEILAEKRIVENSMSTQQRKFFNRHSRSTYSICRKILNLNRTQAEQKALSRRVRYEFGYNLKLLNLRVAFKYMFLLVKNFMKTYPK